MRVLLQLLLVKKIRWKMCSNPVNLCLEHKDLDQVVVWCKVFNHLVEVKLHMVVEQLLVEVLQVVQVVQVVGAELGVMLLEVVLHMVVLVHMKGQYRILPDLDLEVVQVEAHIKGQQVEIFIHQVPVDQIEDNLKLDLM